MKRERQLEAVQQAASQAFESFASARAAHAPQHVQTRLGKDAIVAIKHAQKVGADTGLWHCSCSCTHQVSRLFMMHGLHCMADCLFFWSCRFADSL